MAISDYEQELRTIKDGIDALTKRQKELTNLIKKEHKNGYSQTYGGIQVQVIPEFITLELDQDKLRKEYPSIYQSCLKLAHKDSVIKVVLAKNNGK